MQVKTTTDFVQLQLSNLEQDLSKIALDGLKGLDLTSPYADESTARIIARVLLYGVTGLLLLYFLSSCCTPRSANAISSTAPKEDIAPSKQSSSAGTGRKQTARGKPRTRLPDGSIAQMR